MAVHAHVVPLLGVGLGDSSLFIWQFSVLMNTSFWNKSVSCFFLTCPIVERGSELELQIRAHQHRDIRRNKCARGMRILVGGPELILRAAVATGFWIWPYRFDRLLHCSILMVLPLSRAEALQSQVEPTFSPVADDRS